MVYYTDPFFFGNPNRECVWHIDWSHPWRESEILRWYLWCEKRSHHVHHITSCTVLHLSRTQVLPTTYSKWQHSVERISHTVESTFQLQRINKTLCATSSYTYRDPLHTVNPFTSTWGFLLFWHILRKTGWYGRFMIKRFQGTRDGVQLLKYWVHVWARSKIGSLIPNCWKYISTRRN